MKKIIISGVCLAIVIAVGSFWFFKGSVASGKKMKLYAMYTQTHEHMLNNWFLPSLKATDNYDIVLEKHDQKCVTGKFGEDGWFETMAHKVDIVIRGIKENWNDVFVHADVDIQFFGPTQDLIKKLMCDKDMLFQLDTPYGMPCAGFFACRGNEKTLRLWQKIRDTLLDKDNKKNDQLLLYDFLMPVNRFAVRWGYLPTTAFIGGGTFTGLMWQPGIPLKVPTDTRMHHANSNVGLDQKVQQLSYVRQVMEANKRIVMV